MKSRFPDRNQDAFWSCWKNLTLRDFNFYVVFINKGKCAFSYQGSEVRLLNAASLRSMAVLVAK